VVEAAGMARRCPLSPVSRVIACTGLLLEARPVPVCGGIPWHPPQDHLNLGRKQLNVYFGRIFIRAPRLELEELNHLRHKATEISPQILWSIVKVIRCEETCFELGLANSCLLELGEKSNNRSAPNHPLTYRKICLA
jgi:hypothetical protein